VLKLLSETRVDATEYGVYSHWFGDLWLAGGASNAGGNILRREFSANDLIELSRRIDPETPSDLDYYPLSGTGERFPINDPDLVARITPRPDDPAQYLKGLLDGLAGIEALGYQRLAELGATALKSVSTAGGGSANPVWTRMRQRRLGVPVSVSPQQEAAYGAARLAHYGTDLFPRRTP
jgi:sugar (pentulose or hexulose) kinase